MNIEVLSRTQVIDIPISFTNGPVWDVLAEIDGEKWQVRLLDSDIAKIEDAIEKVMVTMKDFHVQRACNLYIRRHNV